MPPLSVVYPFVGAGALLGLGIPLSRLAGNTGVPATAFAFWPTLTAGLVLAWLAWWRHGALTLNTAVLRFGLVSGLLGHALPVSASIWLTAEVGSSLVAAAFTLPPLFTLIGSMLIGQQRPTWRHAIAIPIGLVAGVSVVATSETGSAGSLALPLIALLIPVLIGAANVYRAAHLPREVPSMWLGAKMLLFSSVGLAVIGALHGGLELPVQSGTGWALAQTVALIGGYLLFFLLQRRATPLVVSLVGYAMMLTGLVAAALLFGETPAIATLSALAVVAGAVWWLGSTSTAPAPIDCVCNACEPACA